MNSNLIYIPCSTIKVYVTVTIVLYYIQILKDRLKETMPNQVFSYSCEYDGVTSSLSEQEKVWIGSELAHVNIIC